MEQNIKNKILNLYGGDTEYFKKYHKEIMQMAINDKTIPQIVFELFHTYNVMATPDSLTGYFKAYDRNLKPSRKNKRILLDDDEYQLALEERARVNNCNYQYYSRSAKQAAKNKRLEEKKSRIGEVSLRNFKNSDFKEIKQILSQLKNKRQNKWIDLKETDSLDEVASITKEVYELDKDIKEYEGQLDFLEGIMRISSYLKADINSIHITYLKKEEN